MNKHLMKLAEEVKSIAYELDVFGVEGAKIAAQKLYEYELGDFKFFSKDKIPAGFRLPVGKAKWTKNYFPVSGQLAKGLEEADAED